MVLDNTIPGWFDASLLEIYEKKRRIDEIRRELNGGYSKT